MLVYKKGIIEMATKDVFDPKIANSKATTLQNDLMSIINHAITDDKNLTDTVPNGKFIDPVIKSSDNINQLVTNSKYVVKASEMKIDKSDLANMIELFKMEDKLQEAGFDDDPNIGTDPGTDPTALGSDLSNSGNGNVLNNTISADGGPDSIDLVNGGDNPIIGADNGAVGDDPVHKVTVTFNVDASGNVSVDSAQKVDAAQIADSLGKGEQPESPTANQDLGNLGGEDNIPDDIPDGTVGPEDETFPENTKTLINKISQKSLEEALQKAFSELDGMFNEEGFDDDSFKSIDAEKINSSIQQMVDRDAETNPEIDPNAGVDGENADLDADFSADAAGDPNAAVEPVNDEFNPADLDIGEGASFIKQVKEDLDSILGPTISLLEKHEPKKTNRIKEDIDSIFNPTLNLIEKYENRTPNKMTKKNRKIFTEDIVILPAAGESYVWNQNDAVKRIEEMAIRRDKTLNVDLLKAAYLFEDNSSNKTINSYKFPIADIIDGKVKLIPKAVLEMRRLFNNSVLLNNMGLTENAIRSIRRKLDVYASMLGAKLSEWSPTMTSENQVALSESTTFKAGDMGTITIEDDPKKCILRILSGNRRRDALATMQRMFDQQS
jgi:hypothetical protein